MARFSHSTDNKGRVIVPAKLREELGLVCYVTLSLDPGYLSVYTDRQWIDLRAQMNALPGTNPDVRRLKRTILGEAIRCQLDSQGRIAVSDELWQMIGVAAGDEVYIIDLGDSLQITGKAHFEREREALGNINELDLTDFDIRGIV